MGTIYSNSNPPPTGSAPSINSFSPAQASIKHGQSTMLNWNVTGSNYNLISGIGPVRGTSIQISPKKTTTYTLDATNQYGRAAGVATVVVK